MLGNMEQWVYEWGGFPAMAVALAEGGNRTVLEAELDDYTFCHLGRDGAFADRLSNGADGLTEATWDAYQDTHYPAAVRHGVETLAAPDGHHHGRAGCLGATGQIEPTGGLEPFVFAMVGSSTWLSVSDTGLITAAPDSTVNPQTYSGYATVTDALGTLVQLTIEVTVTASGDQE